MVVIQQGWKQRLLDIFALLKAGITLPEALGGAKALYPETFAPNPTLKALCYFKDGDLSSLPKQVQEFLCLEASKVNKIAEINRVSDKLVK